MKDSKNHWGLVLFLFSFALAGTAAAFLSWFPARSNQSLYQHTIPITGMALAFACFCLGHFSYPRIHDLRVYISGYLSALIGGMFFGFTLLKGIGPIPDAPLCFFDAVYVLTFINWLFIPFLPASATYRVTKQITIPIVAVEFFALVLAGFAPSSMAWLETILESDRYLWVAYWFPVLWSGGVILLTTRFIHAEFHLGGMIAGASVIYAFSWVFMHVLPQGESYELAAFAGAQAYVFIGLALHWFIRIEHRIQYDPLLKIYNRDYCMQILAEKSSLDSTPPFTIAMIDIDHFKKVNDTHGHQAGDTVLHAVAQAVKQSVMPDGVLCRYGGEELAVFFPGKDSVAAKPILEKTRMEVENTTIAAGKKKLSVTISAGISHRASRSQSLSDVVAAADKALYKAKEGGRNQVKVGKTPEKEKKK
jgi:diguanylate cyclase (GGDEF)-like protein